MSANHYLPEVAAWMLGLRKKAVRKEIENYVIRSKIIFQRLVVCEVFIAGSICCKIKTV
jgi:hypothetical protein